VVVERLVGAFVFPEFWGDSFHAKTRLAIFRECGINAVMTEAETYDPAAVDATHAAGLRFYAGLACFSDHASNFRLIRERPELWPILENGEPRPQLEWYVGMTPSDRRRQADLFATIGWIARKNPIDGLFLDFVRWPLHWEIELRPGRPRPLDSSFDAATLARFEDATGIAPPADLTSVAARAAWIRGRCFHQWVDFKCKVVTDFVGEARSALKQARPVAELGIYVVPEVDGLTEPLTGQRLRDLHPLVDWVSPMLYHNILLKAPGWIGAALAQVTRIAGRKTLPVLQADSNRDPALAAYWGPPMSAADWSAALGEIAAPDVAGLVVFPGAALFDNDRGQALRRTVEGP